MTTHYWKKKKKIYQQKKYWKKINVYFLHVYLLLCSIYRVVWCLIKIYKYFVKHKFPNCHSTIVHKFSVNKFNFTFLKKQSICPNCMRVIIHSCKQDSPTGKNKSVTRRPFTCIYKNKTIGNFIHLHTWNAYMFIYCTLYLSYILVLILLADILVYHKLLSYAPPNITIAIT